MPLVLGFIVRVAQRKPIKVTLEDLYESHRVQYSSKNFIFFDYFRKYSGLIRNTRRDPDNPTTQVLGLPDQAQALS
ncbi:hypothetical protein ABHI18_007766 [Aspergillus niger]